MKYIYYSQRLGYVINLWNCLATVQMIDHTAAAPDYPVYTVRYLTELFYDDLGAINALQQLIETREAQMINNTLELRVFPPICPVVNAFKLTTY